MLGDKDIILGSGFLYHDEFDGEIPTNAQIEVPANLLGAIKGGCSLDYKPTYVTEEDDLGTASKTVLTNEDVTIKSGVITLNGNTFEVLSSTARVSEADGIRTVKIGGIANDNGKSYVIHFVHYTGRYRVTIVGKNQSGFTISFEKDKGTVVDVEFKAEPCDATGTKIIF